MENQMQGLKTFLDQKADEYNRRTFIKDDPIQVPHQFANRQDIEIAGFLTALIAWGNRTTIINSANRMMAAMDHAPHQFIIAHKETDIKDLLDIRHRTFNATDLLYLVSFLKTHYQTHHSLEQAFMIKDATTMRQRLIDFHDYVFSFEHPERTRKHVATPARQSACKRMNMFLRWMVRKDDRGVDFGLWQHIKMKELICPLDVHVCNVAYRLGLLREKKANWNRAYELTERLREFDPNDPVRYDFALFALGAEERIR